MMRININIDFNQVTDVKKTDNTKSEKDASYYPIQKGDPGPCCLIRVRNLNFHRDFDDITKVYDNGNDNFKLNQIFEFVGILNFSGPTSQA